MVQLEAPVGGESDFKVIETIGKPRDFSAEGIKVKDHVEIGSDLKLIDIESVRDLKYADLLHRTAKGVNQIFVVMHIIDNDPSVIKSQHQSIFIRNIMTDETHVLKFNIIQQAFDLQTIKKIII